MRASPLPTLLAIALSVCASARPALADDWEHVSDKDGVRLDRRRVPGSSYYEVRATASSPLSPARLAAAIWADRHDGRFTAKNRRSHRLIADRGDEQVVYERMATPVVKDRDYVVRLRRSGDPEAGRFRVDFRIDESGEGPGPQPGCVRAKDIWGTWTVARGRDGGSELVYIVHSDPGGAIPAFLVHGPQLDTTREVVLEVLDWARAHAAQASR